MLLRASPPTLLLDPLDPYRCGDSDAAVPRIVASDVPHDNIYGPLDSAPKLPLALPSLQDARRASVDSDMYENSDAYFSPPHSYTANYQLVNRDQDSGRQYSPVSPASSPVESESYHEPPVNPSMEAYMQSTPHSQDLPYNHPRYAANAQDYAQQPRAAAYDAPSWSPNQTSDLDRAVLARYGVTAEGPSSSDEPSQARHAGYSITGRSGQPSPPLSDYRWDPSPGEARADISAPVDPASEQMASAPYSPPHSYPYPSPPGHPMSSLPGQIPTVPISPSVVGHSSTSPYLRGGPRSPNASSKTYAFVSLAGNAVKKRPRRRYDEIERLYQCSYTLSDGSMCTKSYGTLNHLNAHIGMQRHGEKRSPAEFKELRKQWRKAKKESESADNIGHPGGRRHSRPQLGVHIPMADSYSYSADEAEAMSRYSAGGAYSATQHSHTPSVLPYPLSMGTPAVRMDAGMQDRGHYTGEGYDSRLLRRSSMPTMPSDGHRYPGRFLPPHYAPPAQQGYAVPPGQPLDHDPHRPSDPRAFPSQLSQQTTYLTPISPVMNRLAPDSTLLTPLPGYVPDRTLTSPLSAGIHAETSPAVTPDYPGRSQWDTPPGSIPNYR